jgi:hypothetical protein
MLGRRVSGFSEHVKWGGGRTQDNWVCREDCEVWVEFLVCFSWSIGCLDGEDYE